MERNELEGLVAVYESGFVAIQGILEDDELRAREKLDAIGDVVFGDGESEADDERGE
ncbi:MAG: hypothetical protein AAB092_04480 [Chloroflexota bacterium]